MSVPVQPLSGYVVVQAEEAPAKTASGLFLPNGTAEKPKVAKVVAVGPDIQYLKAGDRVIYKNEYESTTVKIDGQDYVIVFHQNVVAVVK